MDSAQRPEELFEGVDVNTIRLRPHLVESLSLFDNQGNLRRPAARASQASSIPSSSISSSQTSGSDGGHSSGIDLGREQPGTPTTAKDGLDDTTSTVNATHGTARTIRDFDHVPFKWNQTKPNETHPIDLEAQRDKKQEQEEDAGQRKSQTRPQQK